VLEVIYDQGLRDHPSHLDGGTRWSGIRCVDAERTSDSWRSEAGRTMRWSRLLGGGAPC
jgi:hypothetical protein